MCAINDIVRYNRNIRLEQQNISGVGSWNDVGAFVANVHSLSGSHVMRVLLDK